jgi:hypothetical protein
LCIVGDENLLYAADVQVSIVAQTIIRETPTVRSMAGRELKTAEVGSVRFSEGFNRRLGQISGVEREGL